VFCLQSKYQRRPSYLRDFCPTFLDCFLVAFLLQAVLEPDVFAFPTRFFAPTGAGVRLAIAFLARLATALTAVSGQRSCCLGCEIGHLLDDRLLRLVGPLLWFRFIGVRNETPAHDLPRLAHAAAATKRQKPMVEN
jgi:hypothetical protein